MKNKIFARSFAFVTVLGLVAASAFAQSAANFKSGKADVHAVSRLAFGPDGVLFVGDSLQGMIFAIDTQDKQAPLAEVKIDVKGINGKIAAMLGTEADQILINDLKVNPISKKVYMALSRGRGPDGVPVLLRLDSSGKIEQFSFDNVRFDAVSLTDLPESKPNAAPVAGRTAAGSGATSGNPRTQAISDLAYADGKVFVSGLTNEEFSSDLRVVPYPFEGPVKGAGIKIWHSAHGRYETASPIQAFVPYTIDKQPQILASYFCTPLVKIPIKDLKPGSKVMGTTIAEMGSGSRPLDMVEYRKDGHEYILMSNTTRGVMKFQADTLDMFKPITPPSAACEVTEPARGGNSCQEEMIGVPYQKIENLKGVWQLAKLDDTHALVLADSEGTLKLGAGQATWFNVQEGRSLDLTTVILP